LGWAHFSPDKRLFFFFFFDFPLSPSGIDAFLSEGSSQIGEPEWCSRGIENIAWGAEFVGVRVSFSLFPLSAFSYYTLPHIGQRGDYFPIFFSIFRVLYLVVVLPPSC